MADNDSKLTQARLKELLHYDPETGLFTRLSRHGQALAGDIAGEGRPGKRVTIGIENSVYDASHLAWLYVHGELPKFRIYRKNKDRSDNRIENFFDPRFPVPKVVPGQLTADRLRELLHYDPETGVFTNLTQRGQNIKIGTQSGVIENTGYIRMAIDGGRYQAHRLAWLYVHGTNPVGVIDHINGITTDNRISNLRDVTKAENSQNVVNGRSDNATGLLGVHRRANGKFRASITTDGVKVHLGIFTTPEAASAAYIAAKRVLHSTCTI